MNIYLIILCTLFAIWLLGAFIAIISMGIVNITILARYDSEYTRKDFIEGFLKSWVTLFFVGQVIINEMEQ
jgi:hypothetical protein